MDREHILNSYNEELYTNESIKNDAEYYLDKLYERFKGTTTLYDIIMEIDKFLEKTDLPSKVYDDIKKIRNGFNENTNAIMARRQIEKYLEKYKEDKEADYNKANDTVDEIKEEFIDKQEKRLDDVGIRVTGEKEELKENVEDEADVDKIEENVDNAVEYYEEMNKYNDDYDKEKVEIDYHELTSSLDNSGNETILNSALEDNMQIYKSDNPMNLNLEEDGTIKISGDSNNSSSLNDAAMLTLMLVTNDPNLSLGTSFDMVFDKNKQDVSKFTITFGDFPIEKHQDRKVTELLMAKINKAASLYDKSNNYIDNLAVTSPELREAFMLINDNIMGKEGNFKLAVRNTGNANDLAFGFDENYANVGEAFRTNGADTINKGDYNIVHLNEIDKTDQALMISNTNKTLKEEEQKQIETNAKDYAPQKIKTLEEVANVDTKFLQVLVVANILMLIVLIALIVLTILN